MMLRSPQISGAHKTQLLSDFLHAAVVLTVVLCATTLTAFDGAHLPPDVLGTVYGGAIGYAAGRAGNITRTRMDDAQG